MLEKGVRQRTETQDFNLVCLQFVSLKSEKMGFKKTILNDCISMFSKDPVENRNSMGH